MNNWHALNELLRTDPRDIGCDLALDALHTYAEMTASGDNPADIFLGLMAHLQSCSACWADHEALLRALREFDEAELL